MIDLLCISMQPDGFWWYYQSTVFWCIEVILVIPGALGTRYQEGPQHLVHLAILLYLCCYPDLQYSPNVKLLLRLVRSSYAASSRLTAITAPAVDHHPLKALSQTLAYTIKPSENMLSLWGPSLVIWGFCQLEWFSYPSCNPDDLAAIFTINNASNNNIDCCHDTWLINKTLWSSFLIFKHCFVCASNYFYALFLLYLYLKVNTHRSGPWLTVDSRLSC